MYLPTSSSQRCSSSSSLSDLPTSTALKHQDVMATASSKNGYLQLLPSLSSADHAMMNNYFVSDKSSAYSVPNSDANTPGSYTMASSQCSSSTINSGDIMSYDQQQQQQQQQDPVDVFHSDAQLIMEASLKDGLNLAHFTVLIISKMFNVKHPNPSNFIAYLQKLYDVTEIPFTVVIYALKYLDRLYNHYPSLSSNANNQQSRSGVVTGMFTTAIILANHFIEDHAYTNKTWSEVTGIHYKMINTTQRQFMALIDYRLHITRKEYYEWTMRLFQIYSVSAYKMPSSASSSSSASVSRSIILEANPRTGLPPTPTSPIRQLGSISNNGTSRFEPYNRFSSGSSRVSTAAELNNAIIIDIDQQQQQLLQSSNNNNNNTSPSNLFSRGGSRKQYGFGKKTSFLAKGVTWKL